MTSEWCGLLDILFISAFMYIAVTAFIQGLTIYFGRCLTFPTHLDDGGVSRSREHTDALVDSVSFGILWDEYGIIGELVVCTPYHVNHASHH